MKCENCKNEPTCRFKAEGKTKEHCNFYISSSPEPSGWVWHDIETAPKDGETILLMQGRNRICCTGRWSEQHNHWATGPGPMASLAEVTHWTSLKEAVEYWDRQHTPNDGGEQ